MSSKEDDLFKESSMSFGDHLEELRGCIFRCIVGIAVCFIIGLFFGASVMQVIQQPLTRALTRYLDKQNQTKITKIVEQGYPAEIAEKAFKSGLLVETVYLNRSELRDIAKKNLQMEDAPASDLPEGGEIVQPAPPIENAAATENSVNNVNIPSSQTENASSAANNPPAPAPENTEEPTPGAWDYLMSWWRYANGDLPDIQSKEEVSQYGENREKNFVKVYVWKPKDENERTHTRALSAQEPFMIYIKASFLVGAVLSCPWVFYQIWLFIVSGLYPHERKYVYIYFPMSIALFIAGAAMAFIWVFDPVLGFLMLFNEWMNIEPDLRINEWLGFVMLLPIGFGISFQLPLVMLFLERIGIFSVEWYKENWRIVILVIAILSVVLTPADPTSMLLMFIPLTFLFVVGLALCKYMPR